MNIRYLLLILCFFTFNSITSQAKLSVYSEVSILTVGPGEDLHVAFGHSAIRVKDPVLNLDLVYNYGVFDFDAPNFLLNFANGNMIYSLARYDFKYFLASYKNEKRWVKQQTLNLNQQEKQAYFLFLENNALPKNKNYQYDPYFNNCATKLRDITTSILKEKVVFFDNNKVTNISFRKLTNNELLPNSWSSFGLNLIAGTKLDKKTTLDEQLFLPDYVYKSFKEARLFRKNQPEELVKKETILLNFEENIAEIILFNPLFCFTLFLLFTIYITYQNLKKKKRSTWFDFILFFIPGLIGSILLYLWLFSSHSTAPNNFNVFWAFPINLIVAFLMLKKEVSKWIKMYILFLIVLLLVLMLIWIQEIQMFSFVIIPLLISLLIRYTYLKGNLLTFFK